MNTNSSNKAPQPIGVTRTQPVPAALSDFVGFGGLNACLAVTRYER